MDSIITESNWLFISFLINDSLEYLKDFSDMDQQSDDRFLNRGRREILMQAN